MDRSRSRRGSTKTVGVQPLLPRRHVRPIIERDTTLEHTLLMQPSVLDMDT